MIYGSLYLMTDLRQALLAVEHDHYKIAVISEEIIPGVDPCSVDVIPASCLLPPPVAKMAEIDDRKSMQNMKEQKRWEAHYTQLDGTKRTVSFTNYEDAKRFKTVHLSHGNLLEVAIFKVVTTWEEIK